MTKKSRICAPTGWPQGKSFLRQGAYVVTLFCFMLPAGGCQTTTPAAPVLVAAPQAEVVQNRNSSFAIGIAPDRAPPIRVGEKLGFTMSANARVHGHLYLLTASGSVVVLVENLPLKAGQRVGFPPANAGYELRARPPAGQERVVFLATRQPFSGFAGGAAKDGPVQIPVRARDFISQINTATRALPANTWSIVEERLTLVST